MGHLLAEAPGVRLRSVPLVAVRAESELVRGVIDLAVSVSLLSPSVSGGRPSCRSSTWP